ncbi:hypothetical protein [Acinetobacter sp. AC1-2]|uniref:hypothetical protein n=1 Tax=Acinetobacter sp. AC1-2 TaxID=2735132 RepID=UPI0018E0E01A|nr:hypothetical protein [Acinetobacter sp. AC1-2]MBI1449137.1 hypothetical protein [Acinetobacter sp. AC1-2]
MTNNTLKDIAEEQKTFLDEAFGVFRSKTYDKFIFVEGICDKKFLKKKGFVEEDYFYLGMCGKSMVISSHFYFKNIYPYNKIDKIAFIIDNDYDHITNSLRFDDSLFIHSVCKSTKNHYLNDLESYLVNSSALVQWLDEVGGLTLQQVNTMKDEVERESRRIGKYRAANELLKRIKNLPEQSTILFKFDIDDFFDHRNFLFLERDFESRVKFSSTYKNLVDELFILSNSIDYECSEKWRLSRGHDVTELISIYLHTKFGINLSSKEIEQYLRLTIDTSELNSYHMYKDLKDFFEI